MTPMMAMSAVTVIAPGPGLRSFTSTCGVRGLVVGAAHRIRDRKWEALQQSSLLNRKLGPSLPAGTLFFVAVLSALREIMGL